MERNNILKKKKKKKLKTPLCNYQLSTNPHTSNPFLSSTDRGCTSTAMSEAASLRTVRSSSVASGTTAADSEQRAKREAKEGKKGGRKGERQGGRAGGREGRREAALPS